MPIKNTALKNQEVLVFPKTMLAFLGIDLLYCFGDTGRHLWNHEMAISFAGILYILLDGAAIGFCFFERRLKRPALVFTVLILLEIFTLCLDDLLFLNNNYLYVLRILLLLPLINVGSRNTIAIILGGGGAITGLNVMRYLNWVGSPSEKADVLNTSVVYLLASSILFVYLYVVGRNKKETASKASREQEERETRLKMDTLKRKNLKINGLQNQAIQVIIANTSKEKQMVNILDLVKTQHASAENKKLIQRLEKFTKKNDDYTFDTVYETMYADTILQIEKAYPGLTKYETKILLLHGMGLDPAKIATIMVIKENSLKNTKFRMRKKMNLEPRADFYQLMKDLMAKNI